MLVLHDPKHNDAPPKECEVAKSLEALKIGETVWITYTKDLYIKAKVMHYRKNTPYLVSGDWTYFIDEYDDDEPIQGVFVTLSCASELFEQNKPHFWNKEGF